MRVEKNNEQLKEEIKRLEKRPPQTLFVAEKCCRDCYAEGYKKKLEEVEKVKKSIDEDKKAAEKNKKYFYSLVNNYKVLIDEKVNKIVKRKTAVERLINGFLDFLPIKTDLFFYLPFLYSVVITVVSIFRNDVVRNDFIEAGKSFGKGYSALFGGIKRLILNASELSLLVSNPKAEIIVRYAIIVFLIAAIAVTAAFFARLLYRLFNKLYDAMADYEAVLIVIEFPAALLAVTGLVTFWGERIKAIIPLNLAFTAVILISVFYILWIAINVIYKKVSDFINSE